MPWWPIGVALWGCHEDPPGSTGTAQPEDSGTEGCDNVVVARDPADGATDVPLDPTVTFALAEPDATAVVTVIDAAGDEVPGVSAVDGATVGWSAEAPLVNDTSYTATLTHACGTATTRWTTEPIPVVPVLDPTGGAFAVALGDGRWLEPAGIGELLAQQLGDTQIFVEATSASLTGPDTTLDLLLALGSGDTQDLCLPTTAAPAVPYVEPAFTWIGTSFVLPLGGFDVPLEALEVTGAFAPDLSRIVDVRFGGTIDTRLLGEAFGLGYDDGAVCELVLTFGVNCLVCPSGVGPYCLNVRVDQLVAPAVPGLSLQERTEADITADPQCD